MKHVLPVIALCLLCVGCAHVNPLESDPVACGRELSGFWFGLWNGMTVPFSFFGSLLDPNIEIYDVCNNGGWYAFGFWLGVGGLGTSGATTYHSRY